MQEPKEIEQHALRQRILQQAGEMVRAEGVAGISMRKLSKAIGASTMVLYTYFKNKTDLLNELYLEGYSNLRTKLEAVVPGEDPFQYVMDLGRAYRRAALENPGAYDLMHSSTLQGLDLPESSREMGRQSFKVLADATARCMQAGVIAESDPKAMAQILWAGIHGPISLQIAGHFESDAEAETRFETTLTILKHGLLATQ